MNTVIVPCSINYKYKEWYTRGGLLTDILFVVLAVAFAEPFMNLLNPFYLIKLYRRWKLRRKTEKTIMRIQVIKQDSSKVSRLNSNLDPMKLMNFNASLLSQA